MIKTRVLIQILWRIIKLFCSYSHIQIDKTQVRLQSIIKRDDTK